MPNPEQAGFTRESGPSTEAKFKFNVAVILIAGHPGTGKSRVAEILSQELGIKSVKLGNHFRKRALIRTGTGVTGFKERSLAEDIRMDGLQQRLIRSATPAHPFILESKLGGFLVHQMREEAKRNNLPPPSVVTILFKASPEVRYKRVAKREGITEEEAKAQTINRQTGDATQWTKVHPELAEIGDPLDPDNAGFMYDYVIDVEEPSALQVKESIFNLFSQNNYIEERKAA